MASEVKRKRYDRQYELCMSGVGIVMLDQLTFHTKTKLSAFAHKKDEIRQAKQTWRHCCTAASKFL